MRYVTSYVTVPSAPSTYVVVRNPHTRVRAYNSGHRSPPKKQSPSTYRYSPTAFRSPYAIHIVGTGQYFGHRQPVLGLGLGFCLYVEECARHVP